MITEHTPERTSDLFEVLQKVEKASSRKEKAALLQKHGSPAVLDYLRATFDDNIQFNLPSGSVPYVPCKVQSIPSSWSKQHMQLKYFVKGFKASESLSAFKRESLYIGMLESVHPEDAEILVGMINKKSTTKGLTKKLVQEAFPNLIK